MYTLLNKSQVTRRDLTLFKFTKKIVTTIAGTIIDTESFGLDYKNFFKRIPRSLERSCKKK